MKVQHNKTYPLADYHPEARRSAGQVVARWDGERKRLIKKGEWYLSGAEIAAYKAPNNLSTEYHAAKVVRMKHRVNRDWKDGKIIQTIVTEFEELTD